MNRAARILRNTVFCLAVTAHGALAETVPQGVASVLTRMWAETPAAPATAATQAQAPVTQAPATLTPVAAAAPQVTRSDVASVVLRPLSAPREDVLAQAAILAASLRPAPRPAQVVLPDLRWSHVEGSDRWGRAVIKALKSHGKPLVELTPNDIGAWCPGYVHNDANDRKLFWAGLISALAKHESTYRPTAVGDNGRSFGLLQIRPATAKHFGCAVTTGQALKNGEANMACAVRIMAKTVSRDRVVSAGFRGVAADWGPFHQSSKREDMRAWVKRQEFCEAPADLAAVKPVPRPNLAELALRDLRRVKPAPRPVAAVETGASAPLDATGASEASGGLTLTNRSGRDAAEVATSTRPAKRPLRRPVQRPVRG